MIPRVGERTTLAKNSPKFESLRTTVPINVVRQWKLKVGDELDWEWKIIDGEMAQVVRKVEKSK